MYYVIPLAAAPCILFLSQFVYVRREGDRGADEALQISETYNNIATTSDERKPIKKLFGRCYVGGGWPAAATAPASLVRICNRR